ncbi:MAG: GIY-YIG nuclease family protein [Bacteroidota bacterium]
MKSYYVYILASITRCLYTGITNDLERRLVKHRSGHGSGFARRYRIQRLVYVEVFTNVREAIAREKQIKRWRRATKVRLIEAMNPTWKDLHPE